MPKTREPLRLDVRKTYKLYVNGAFVRSESGRTDVARGAGPETASVARASRKDLRDAVVAARTALATWSAFAPMNRGLILYRLAEMMDARRGEFVERLRFGAKLDEVEALRETTAAIDRALWYAGWCDKYAAVLSSRNPVAGPYASYSSPEPVGVVGAIAPDEPSLLGLVSAVVPPLVSGNTVVVLASESDPRTAIVFAECLATCDPARGCGERVDRPAHRSGPASRAPHGRQRPRCLRAGRAVRGRTRTPLPPITSNGRACVLSLRTPNGSRRKRKI